MAGLLVEKLPGENRERHASVRGCFVVNEGAHYSRPERTGPTKGAVVEALRRAC